MPAASHSICASLHGACGAAHARPGACLSPLRRLLAPDGVRFASLKALKMRLTSVKSIQKITKAMKMASA